MRKLIIFLLCIIALVALIKFQPAGNKPGDEQIKSDVAFFQEYEDLVSIEVKGVRVKENLAQAFVEIQTRLRPGLDLAGEISREDNFRKWSVVKKYFYPGDTSVPDLIVDADARFFMDEEFPILHKGQEIFYYIKTDRGWTRISLFGMRDVLEKTFGPKTYLMD